MMPNAKKHNPDPVYLRSLIKRAGVSQREAARIIGVKNERTFRRYLTLHAADYQPCDYPIQYALENLADGLERLRVHEQGTAVGESVSMLLKRQAC